MGLVIMCVVGLVLGLQPVPSCSPPMKMCVFLPCAERWAQAAQGVFAVQLHGRMLVCTLTHMHAQVGESFMAASQEASGLMRRISVSMSAMRSNTQGLPDMTGTDGVVRSDTIPTTVFHDPGPAAYKIRDRNYLKDKKKVRLRLARTAG